MTISRGPILMLPWSVGGVVIGKAGDVRSRGHVSKGFVSCCACHAARRQRCRLSSCRNKTTCQCPAWNGIGPSVQGETFLIRRRRIAVVPSCLAVCRDRAMACGSSGGKYTAEDRRVAGCPEDRHDSAEFLLFHGSLIENGFVR